MEEEPLENPDEIPDMDVEIEIEDVEGFMLALHEFAYWNVELSYLGVPPEFKPIYIALKMERDPVAIPTLQEKLPAEDVSEILRQHVIIHDESFFVTENIKVDIIEHLSKRMDYYNKLKLVDKGLATMSWDSELGEPVFNVKKDS